MLPLSGIMNGLLSVNILSRWGTKAHVLNRPSIFLVELLSIFKVRFRLVVVAMSVVGREAHLL